MNNLVLWHGWGISNIAWSSLAKHLPANSQPQLQSLPGYDGTAVPSQYTADALVEKLMEPWSSPITLCGWSMGSMLAMLAAHRYPEKIERLILIGATPCFVQNSSWSYGMTPELLEFFMHAVRLDGLSLIKRFVALFNQNDSHARSIIRALALTDLPPREVLEDGLALLRDTDLRAIVPKIRQPTLLIHGAHDPLMSLDSARWLASKLPDARLEIFPHAAHAPFLSDPTRCAALITHFLHD